ncbi:hypothetical protein [Methylobacterium sp. E-065]|uniref:hypothetical protein n=1 Tax=Methylobacterium sp. E-065 TaxID=2836583 RepID=UPI00391DEFEA
MQLQPEGVALPKRAVDLHHVGQDQGRRRHADEGVHEIEDAVAVGDRLEVAGPHDGNAAAARVEGGHEVGWRLAAARPNRHAERGVDDQAGPEGQPQGPEQDVDDKDDRAAEGQHGGPLPSGRIGGGAEDRPGEMGDPVRDQAGPDARVEYRQEDVGEDEAHDEHARCLFEGGWDQASHRSDLRR